MESRAILVPTWDGDFIFCKEVVKMVQVKLKDGSIREVAQGTTLGELAEQLSRSLAKKYW